MLTDVLSRLKLFELGGNNKKAYEWNYVLAPVGTPADARLVPEIWGSMWG